MGSGLSTHVLVDGQNSLTHIVHKCITCRIQALGRRLRRGEERQDTRTIFFGGSYEG